MGIGIVWRGEKVYLEWKIAEAVPIHSLQSAQGYPYLITALISPADTRAFAQSLLDAADMAENIQSGRAPR